MTKFSPFISVLLVVLMSNLPVDSAFSDSLTNEEQINAIRQQSNQAIASHDAAGVVAAFDTEYQVTAGSGALFSDTLEEEVRHWQEIFAQAEDIVYTRTPEKIEVSSYLPRAAEHGRWIGSWTTATGRKELGGSYYATWSKTDGQWKIRSESFVTLFCKGLGC